MENKKNKRGRPLLKSRTECMRFAVKVPEDFLAEYGRVKISEEAKSLLDDFIKSKIDRHGKRK